MARSLNKTFFRGNLTKDVEVRQAGTTNVAKFSLALNESWKDKTTGEYKNSVEYADFELWGVAAPVFAEKTSKGDLVFVEAKYTQQSWEDKEGNPRKSTIFRVQPGSWEVFGRQSASKQSGESESQNQEQTEEIPF